ncbi:MAG: LuxR C-terminal-related transcriptional regulator [Pyrinomonadaceae bacterium]|nr:LuxR C-terminal-related transcriptional regulator [Pyrinomonadaceae bacterium]
MRLGEIKNLVEGTGDAAFALDSNGFIVAWNKAAAELFGLTKNKVVGLACKNVIQGVDECGRACTENCTIQQRARNHQPLKNYDIQINANGRKQWCNVSVLIVDEKNSTNPYTVHIVRQSDIQKRFELLVRDFVINETSLPSVNVNEILATKSAPSSVTELTKREIEILKLLSKGEKTAEIADKLFISRTTANNHIQHIMKKLAAHSRLEAVRRAEQAGLI